MQTPKQIAWCITNQVSQRRKKWNKEKGRGKAVGRKILDRAEASVDLRGQWNYL